MTDKKTKNGLPAPESKHAVTSDVEKSAHLAGAVVAATARFAVIFGCAAALGFLLNWAELHWKFIPHWMIAVGHLVEWLLYAYDIIGFVFDVTLHFFRHMKHGWKEFRKETAKPVEG